jgi:hypothetical protein
MRRKRQPIFPAPNPCNPRREAATNRSNNGVEKLVDEFPKGVDLLTGLLGHGKVATTPGVPLTISHSARAKRDSSFDIDTGLGHPVTSHEISEDPV